MFAGFRTDARAHWVAFLRIRSFIGASTPLKAGPVGEPLAHRPRPTPAKHGLKGNPVIWLWVKTVLGSHFGVGAPPSLVYFSGDWDVHWGYGLLTHGHLDSRCSLEKGPVFPCPTCQAVRPSTKSLDSVALTSRLWLLWQQCELLVPKWVCLF